MSQGKCLFYLRTGDGTRCVLLPPEEWRKVRERVQGFCEKGGAGCPILMEYYRIRESGNFENLISLSSRLAEEG